jgi:hypothetical protein
LPYDKIGKEKALETALHFAATLKYEWYFSHFNEGRLKDKEHIELNIGINAGPASLMRYPFHDRKGKNNQKLSYEGFSITLSKRIQSIAEETYSRIIVGDKFYREYMSLEDQKTKNHEFFYLGQRSFKGIAQKFSCYEWIGDELEGYLDFPKKPNKKVNHILKTLYDKNPNNPWYASLLASYYFFLGEEEYDPDKPDNKFYRECARICTSAIQNITKYNLRRLNDLLFDCLEVTEAKWEELSFRTEQAYNSDPTFARALALRAKSLYMLSSKDVVVTTNRLFALFKEKEYESLFIGHFVLARYYATIDKNEPNMLHHFKAAVKCAKDGDVNWAYGEYKESEKDFAEYERKLKNLILDLKEMWELWMQE